MEHTKEELENMPEDQLRELYAQRSEAIEEKELENQRMQEELERLKAECERLTKKKDELVAEFRRKQADPATRIKIERNKPCPCGSGLKYKKCCGKGL